MTLHREVDKMTFCTRWLFSSTSLDPDDDLSIDVLVMSSNSCPGSALIAPLTPRRTFEIERHTKLTLTSHKQILQLKRLKSGHHVVTK